MTDDVRFFMNHDEQIAYKYLCRRFEAERVVYEPDGNIPPDFAVLYERYSKIRVRDLV